VREDGLECLDRQSVEADRRDCEGPETTYRAAVEERVRVEAGEYELEDFDGEFACAESQSWG
jgi:hypothetical protein